MPQCENHVNRDAGALRYYSHAVICWIDHHARTGWYIALIVTADFVLSIVHDLHLF